MIVKRTYGIYRVSYRFVWDMYVLSEQGVKIGGEAVTASRQKLTAVRSRKS